MIIRDPNAPFTPDICSRVTFMNFTATSSSLQNHLLLKNERPDVDSTINNGYLRIPDFTNPLFHSLYVFLTFSNLF